MVVRARRAVRVRFGLSEADELVDVATVASGERPGGGLVCPGCRGRLVAVLGAKRAHHFRHHAAACARETYLHAAAKRAVAEGFNAAVAAGKPYPWLRPAAVRCIVGRKALPVPECLVPRACEVEVDLAERFVRAACEVRVGGFVGDVVLSGPAGELLVELVVSHACSGDKWASGLPLVEVAVATDDDVAAVGSGISWRMPGYREAGCPPPEPVEGVPCRDNPWRCPPREGRERITVLRWRAAGRGGWRGIPPGG